MGVSFTSKSCKSVPVPPGVRTERDCLAIIDTRCAVNPSCPCAGTTRSHRPVVTGKAAGRAPPSPPALRPAYRSRQFRSREPDQRNGHGFVTASPARSWTIPGQMMAVGRAGEPRNAIFWQRSAVGLDRTASIDYGNRSVARQARRMLPQTANGADLDSAGAVHKSIARNLYHRRPPAPGGPQ